MPAPRYEVLVAFTRTGQVIDRLPVTGWSPDESISWADLGSMTIEVPLTGRRGADAGQIETVRSIDRAAWTISCCLVADQRALWAGPAISTGFDAETVSIACTSIAAIFDRRMIIQPGYLTNPMDSAGDVHLNLGSRDLILELLARGMAGSRRDLPIDLPAQSGGSGGAGVDYLAADLKTVFEAVKEITERDDGPDVYLRPVLSLAQDELRWQVELGTPTLGSATSVATFDYPGAIKDLSGETDASECVDTAYVVGDNSSADDAPRLIGVHVNDRGDPHPALERADRTTVSTRQLDVLDALAASYGSAYAAPVQAMKLTVHRDHPPLYGRDWQLGDVVTAHVSGHPYLPDGEYLQRVIGVTGGADELTIEGQAVSR